MPEEVIVKKFEITAYTPEFQVSSVRDFIQGMFNRNAMSRQKYGPIEDSFPHRRTGAENAEYRIRKYYSDHNLEHLVDAATYLLIEFLIPQYPDASFDATDSHRSPGALNVDGTFSHGRD